MTRRPPTRSCVACRTAREKRELLRVVRVPDGTVVADPGGRAAGRGAYVCRNLDCITAAITRGALSRALEIPIPATVRDDLVAALSDTITIGGARGQE